MSASRRHASSSRRSPRCARCTRSSPRARTRRLGLHDRRRCHSFSTISTHWRPTSAACSSAPTLRELPPGFDLLVGALAYRSQLSLLTDWVHHAAYLIITEIAIRNSWTHVFCMCAMMQLPTSLLSASISTPLPRDAHPPAPRHQLLPIIATLPLVQLAADLGYVFGPFKDIEFTHPGFSRLTHLDIYHSSSSHAWPVFLRQL
ncbi:hypothetical protein B0H17DRAFT_162887 [Mycena rosella]|uniref:Uncharacterized protein n=1 Tax=Mycena rosella TaxID=1033263 RepID=A0AAD7G7B7_MYCRO|nr:hypothetical protein B0H17DRAFT_162887 [Mycena rosella]